MVKIFLKAFIGRIIALDVEEGQTVDMWDVVMKAISTEELFEENLQNRLLDLQRDQASCAEVPRGPEQAIEVRTSQQSARLFDIILEAVKTEEAPQRQEQPEPIELSSPQWRRRADNQSQQVNFESQVDPAPGARQEREFSSLQPSAQRSGESKMSKSTGTDARRANSMPQDIGRARGNPTDKTSGSRPPKVKAQSRADQLRGPRQAPEVQMSQQSAPKPIEATSSKPMGRSANVMAQENGLIPSKPMGRSANVMAQENGLIPGNPSDNFSAGLPQFTDYRGADPLRGSCPAPGVRSPQQSAPRPGEPKRSDPTRSAIFVPQEDAQSDDSSDDLHPMISAIVDDGLGMREWIRDKFSGCTCIRTPENRAAKIRVVAQMKSPSP